MYQFLYNMQEFYVFYQILDLEIASPSLCAPQAVQWQRMHLPSRRLRFDPWVRKILWKRKWQPTAGFLVGKSHGQRSLGGL